MENKAQDEPSKLPYKLLKHITNNFDKERILGTGGFGTVFKGVYENREEVAVKVLRNISGLDDKEFQAELKNLRGLKHPNIVELVGFCHEWEEELVVADGKQITADRLRMALCLEYVEPGSLNRLISDPTTGLTWHTRYRIIKGICEGLKYLREDLENPIMHFDLKPANILINKSMVPKIADFGLSRLFGEENTSKTLTKNRGTTGYLPPEFLKHQIISREFDIFSLGVIIVRIICGHENYNSIVDMSTTKSIKMVQEIWKIRLRETLSHASLEVYSNQLKRCIEMALKCLMENRLERPSIQEIVSTLNETEMLIDDHMMRNEQFYQDDGESTINSRPSSENFPILEPRVMPLSLLEKITDNFSETRLLGQGMHGRVYKGDLGHGHVVAVKLLPYRLGFDDMKLENEIAILKKVHHQNIVQFIGYCCHTEKVVKRHEERVFVTEKKYNVLCFEYMSGSLEEYLSLDTSSVLDWQTQYRVIKGICEGLRYLHVEMESPFLHMNLKPRHILFDGQKMLPRIGGFGLAGLFPTAKSLYATTKKKEAIRYIPPEYINRGVITKGIDIFSLGVIILELMTGTETYSKLFDMPTETFVGTEQEKWRERLQKTERGSSVEGYYQQVKKCLEIAAKCVNKDRQKRPNIGEIIHMLNETEWLILKSQISPETEQLLQVHPLELCFRTAIPSSPSSGVAGKKKNAMMSSSCLLQLKNKGHDRVAFMLVANPNSPKRYLTKEPLCGVLSPRCSYTLTVTMRNNKQQPPLSSSDGGCFDFFTLDSVGLSRYHLMDVEKAYMPEIYGNFFKEAKEEVQKATLKVVCDRATSDRGTSSCEIKTTGDAQQVSSIDVHPTEPWIMTTNHVGSLRVWNYKTMAMLRSFESMPYEPAHVAKFIRGEKWLIVGDRDGCILVYNYEVDGEILISKKEDDGEIKRIDAHETCITTLAVHPASPYVLSSSADGDHLIKLWDWDSGWKCTQEFAGHTGRVTQITFNPEKTDRFASASLDGTIKVWNICSNDPSNTGGNVITLKLDAPGLYVDYFTRHNQQQLIVGCHDKTPQIWKLDMKERVHELERHGDHISAVNLHPGLSLLVTGSLDGTVRVWNSSTYKLDNIIDFNLGPVYSLGCTKGSRRIVVGCHHGITMIEIPRH